MFKVVVLFSFLALGCALLAARAAVDDEEVVTAANVVVKALDKQLSSRYHHRLARILNANKQNQGGYITFQLDIVVGETTCKKEEYKFEDVADCDFRSHGSTFKKCQVTVFRDTSGEHKVGPKGCILASGKDIEGLRD